MIKVNPDKDDELTYIPSTFLTHICLNCGIDQIKPSNPFKWCIYCFHPAVSVITKYLLFTRNIKPGYLFLCKNGSGEHFIATSTNPEQSAKDKDLQIVYIFPTDNMERCESHIAIALESVGKTCNSLDIIDYVKTIARYEGGIFYLLNDVNND